MPYLKNSRPILTRLRKHDPEPPFVPSGYRLARRKTPACSVFCCCNSIAGEAEAIALATDLNADIVLIDEQEGRQLASRTGLAVTGVLGILLRAKRAGEIAAVKPEMALPPHQSPLLRFPGNWRKRF